jgi:hypothetical protein
MDILVTTPKSEIEHSINEAKMVEDDGGYYFRTYRFKPKVNIGDKMFFTEDGKIRGYGIIFEVSSTSGETCETTGREWKGSWVVKYNDWHWLKTPIPFKGFQGIRYVDNLPDLKNNWR